MAVSYTTSADVNHRAAPASRHECCPNLWQPFLVCTYLHRNFMRQQPLDGVPQRPVDRALARRMKRIRTPGKSKVQTMNPVNGDRPRPVYVPRLLPGLVEQS